MKWMFMLILLLSSCTGYKYFNKNFIVLNSIYPIGKYVDNSQSVLFKYHDPQMTLRRKNIKYIIKLDSCLISDVNEYKGKISPLGKINSNGSINWYLLKLKDINTYPEMAVILYGIGKNKQIHSRVILQQALIAEAVEQQTDSWFLDYNEDGMADILSKTTTIGYEGYNAARYIAIEYVLYLYQNNMFKESILQDTTCIKNKFKLN